MATTPRLLITAGPTYEPIDAVRFIGNRSSGKLGSGLADHAASLGWRVRLLLGPNAATPEHAGVEVIRFGSCAELDAALRGNLAWCDCLVMAAAVADYRPRAHETDEDGKRRRTGETITLELEPTPDLLRGCAQRRRDDQLLVGFALEPRDELLASARRKLERKGIDLIVANPLETMDADSIEARLIGSFCGRRVDEDTRGPISKRAFASWLLDRIGPMLEETSPDQERTAHASR